MLFHALHWREIGLDSPLVLREEVIKHRVVGLELSRTKEIQDVGGAVNCLSIDLCEARYLLSGRADGAIVLHDVEDASANQTARLTCPSVLTIGKKHGHAFSVSAIEWYPFDTGLFVSVGFDEYMKVWDTNLGKSELQFKFPEKLYCVAMCCTSISHSLVAAGSADPRIRLADLRTGGFTHTLVGHEDAVMSLKWMPGHEFVLTSASADRSIRSWDLRRPGWLLCYDQFKCARTLPHTGQCEILKNTRKHTQQRAPNTGRATAAAHSGRVTALAYTPDGRWLMSSGSDDKMRLWNPHDGSNMLVNYAGIRNPSRRATQIAVSHDGRTVFHPNGNKISGFDVLSGVQSGSLSGHYDIVNCCTFHPFREELYSGSNDRQVLIWTPKLSEASAAARDDDDAWSDVDDAAASSAVGSNLAHT